MLTRAMGGSSNSISQCYHHTLPSLSSPTGMCVCVCVSQLQIAVSQPPETILTSVGFVYVAQVRRLHVKGTLLQTYTLNAKQTNNDSKSSSL